MIVDSVSQPVIKAEQLIAAAQQLKGVPYRHQGRSRAGVDCIGFLILACEEAGFDLPRFMKVSIPSAYGRDPDPKSYALLASNCIQVYKPVPGCVFYFRFPNEKLPRHFGIYTGDSILHAESALRKKVIENGYRAQWLKWTHSMWLVPGVDYSDVNESA